MTNEIKEITDILNYYKTTQKEPVYCEELITTGELQRLLDYITNLQKENERLKDSLETMTFTAKIKQEAIDSLIKKMDKAIEVVRLCNSPCAKETINILQGKDN